MDELHSHLVLGRLWDPLRGTPADCGGHGLGLARATYVIIMYIERGCRSFAASAARLRRYAVGRYAAGRTPGPLGEGPVEYETGDYFDDAEVLGRVDT